MPYNKHVSVTNLFCFLFFLSRCVPLCPDIFSGYTIWTKIETSRPLAFQGNCHQSLLTFHISNRCEWVQPRKFIYGRCCQICSEIIFKESHECWVFALLCRDLCRNYLTGSIPMEWASLPYLTSMLVPSLSLLPMHTIHNSPEWLLKFYCSSLCANNLSGPLPTGLQNFKNLTVLYVSNCFLFQIFILIWPYIDLTKFPEGSKPISSLVQFLRSLVTWPS